MKFLSKKIINQIVEADEDVCLDIEANHTEIHQRDWEMWGVGLAVYCEDYISWYFDDHEDIQIIVNLLILLGKKLVLHNGKYDCRGLRKAGYLVDYSGLILRDTMVGANLINPNLNEKQLGLKPLVYKTFKHKMVTYPEASAYGKDSKQFRDYGSADVFWTLKLWREIIFPQLEKRKMLKLFEKLYMPDLLYVCSEEDRGVKWDTDRALKLIGLKESEYTFGELRDSLEKEIRDVVGYDININSNAQLGKRLFDDLHFDKTGVEKTPKTKVYKLDKETKDKLAVREPLFEKIMKYEYADHMLNGFLIPNTELALKDEHRRLYPLIHVTSKAGRRRQSNPNLQQQPVIKDPNYSIRACVIPPEDFVLLVIDLSQIQLRLGAHTSQDKEMLRAYRYYQCKVCGAEGENNVYLKNCPECGVRGDERTIKEKDFKGFWHGLDIHQMTADATGLPRNPSTGEKAAAKNLNFSWQYKSTPQNNVRQFGTYSLEKWKELEDKHFKKYWGLKEWHIEMEHQMNSSGLVKDIFGRIRQFSKEEIRKHYKHNLNQFINWPILTSEAHILMMCQLKIMRTFEELDMWESDIFPSNEIHDELVLECRKEYAEDSLETAEDCMRYCVEFDVPINVEGKICEFWSK